MQVHGARYPLEEGNSLAFHPGTTPLAGGVAGPEIARFRRFRLRSRRE